MSARKHLEEIPDSSGIYQIRCNQNGEIYVGSAADLRARWRAHRRDLCRGLHHNRYLQRAWDRCGESDFELVVLEYVEVARLLDTDQLWIDRTGCINRCVGYNIKPEATCPGLGIGRTWLGFRDPNGNAVTIVNLADFCRREGLNAGSMHSLSKGQRKLKSHKGWTHVNSVRQRDYIKTHDGFVDPEVASGRIVSHLRMDPHPRQEEVAAPGAQGIDRSGRRSCKNHKSLRFLSRLRPVFGAYVRTQERQAPESQGLDLEA